MELLSIPFSRSRRSKRRARYERLDKSKKNMQVITLGGKTKRSWKIPVMPKLKWRLKIVSPIKLLAKLRDGYINMMLGWAGNVGALNSESVFGEKRIPRARKVETRTKPGDFEAKLVFEIYKSLKTSSELAASR